MSNSIEKILSVIIPVYNDAEGLRVTLSSLISMDAVKDGLEIIVSDNGSTDRTPRIIRKFVKDNPGIVRSVSENCIRGSYAARNKAISIAKGKLIAFIDSDEKVKKN